ncbi:hypothetical protein EW146_g5741 [Bondarzewia mesenterica]|uniref:Uncharacterized protein n=1 Tax=Bondarzewia mesenterica TaxID=1095465 RepID=A0A4S4LSN2_9AGAM|nr:hypothetical protein EW146_g5741 [Bondarzewia mesenterica]
MQTWHFLALPAIAHAAFINRTIDDQYGDEKTGLLPSYSPVAGWSQGANCAGCLAQPLASNAYRNTWHDSTHTPGDAEARTIVMSFNGTAVYTYCILANNVPYATTLTNLSFNVDGSDVGTFVHVPTNSTDYIYDFPVYVNENLSSALHQLIISATGDTKSSLVLFDYMVYTTDVDFVPSLSSISSIPSASPFSSSTSSVPSENPSSIFASSVTTAGSGSDSSSSSGKSMDTGAITGGVVGGVVFIALCILSTLLCLRKRQRNKTHDRAYIVPDSSREAELFIQHRNPSHESVMIMPHPSSSASNEHPGPTLEMASPGVANMMSASDSALVASRIARNKKAARRWDELAGRVQEMQATLASLQSSQRLSGQEAPTPSQPTTSIGGDDADGVDEALRDEIDALRTEIEQLHARQEQMYNWAMMDEPPPEYQNLEVVGAGHAIGHNR